MKRLIIAVAAVALGFGPLARADTKIYDVDPAYRQEVIEILRHLLDVGNPEFGGRAELLPSGQVVVDTYSEQRQAQIAGVLDAIAHSKPEPTPTVTLRYWVLRGIPGADNATGLPSTLDGVARELEEVYGDLGVSIIDAATLTGRSNESVELQNDHWHISQRAIVGGEGDRLDADLEVEHELEHLVVELSIGKGEFVVLGAGTSDQPVENGVIALIVNWPAD